MSRLCQCAIFTQPPIIFPSLFDAFETYFATSVEKVEEAGVLHYCLPRMPAQSCRKGSQVLKGRQSTVAVEAGLQLPGLLVIPSAF